MSTKEKEKLPFHRSPRKWGGRHVNWHIFSNIVSLLWMNAGIHQAGKWSQLSTNSRTTRTSNYLWGGGEGPGSGRNSVWSLHIPKERVDCRLCYQHPKGDKEHKVANLTLFSQEVGCLALSLVCYLTQHSCKQTRLEMNDRFPFKIEHKTKAFFFLSLWINESACSRKTIPRDYFLPH